MERVVRIVWEVEENEVSFMFTFITSKSMQSPPKHFPFLLELLTEFFPHLHDFFPMQLPHHLNSL
jgi:hypothetical protein